MTTPDTRDDATEAGSRARKRRIWIAAEIGVGLFIAWLFAYGFYNAQSLRRDSGVFPIFLAYMGLGLMALHVLQLVVTKFRARGKAIHVEPVEDEDEYDDADPRGIARAYAAIFLLFFACYLIGFHLAVPTFVVVYTAIWGEVRSWWKLALTWISLLLLILLVYGRFMNTPWPRSVLEDALGLDMQRFLLPFVRPLLDLFGI